ncbi:MAG: heme/hemin ABC transporter substrate-binding protein [Acidimicrobiia bacterium]
MTFRVTALASLLLVAASACATNTEPSTTAAAESDTYTGIDGVVASIADTSRIVSLNGDLTETIFALGAGEQVVGIDLTTTFPEAATSLPDVGLGRNLQAEAVIALSPTLVLGDTQVGPDSAIEQIRAAGIPVVILQSEVTLDGVARKISAVGEILGLEQAAIDLASEVDLAIDEGLALAATATSTPRVAYVYVRGPETVLLFGNGMPTHFLIEAAHAIDAAGEVEVVFAEDLNAETLVTASPDVIVTPTAGFDIIGGLDAFRALPGIADTPAGRSGRIVTIDEALLLGMGPRVGQALADLVRELHPELGE